MTHSLLTPALVADLEKLSKTIGQIAMDLKDAGMQDTAVSVTEDAPKKRQTKPLFDPYPKKKEAEEEKSSSQTSADQASEEKVEVTIEQLRALLAEKSQAGLTAGVKDLLNKYGASKLSAVKPEDYSELYEEAKALS